MAKVKITIEYDGQKHGAVFDSEQVSTYKIAEQVEETLDLLSAPEFTSVFRPLAYGEGL